MLDPLAALSLASGVISLITFSADVFVAAQKALSDYEHVADEAQSIQRALEKLKERLKTSQQETPFFDKHSRACGLDLEFISTCEKDLSRIAHILRHESISQIISTRDSRGHRLRNRLQRLCARLRDHEVVAMQLLDSMAAEILPSSDEKIRKDPNFPVSALQCSTGGQDDDSLLWIGQNGAHASADDLHLFMDHGMPGLREHEVQTIFHSDLDTSLSAHEELIFQSRNPHADDRIINLWLRQQEDQPRQRIRSSDIRSIAAKTSIASAVPLLNAVAGSFIATQLTPIDQPNLRILAYDERSSLAQAVKSRTSISLVHPSPLTFFLALFTSAALMVWFVDLTRKDRYQKRFLLGALIAWLMAFAMSGIGPLNSAAADLPWVMFLGILFSSWFHTALRCISMRTANGASVGSA